MPRIVIRHVGGETTRLVRGFGAVCQQGRQRDDKESEKRGGVHDRLRSA